MFQIAGNIELLGKKFWRRREKQTYETVALGLNANFSDHWQMRNQIGKKKAPTVDTSKDLRGGRGGRGTQFLFFHLPLICYRNLRQRKTN